MNLQNVSQPLVSVIIPNYNYAHFLGQCLESVLNQSYLNLEIILIDDGSSDNSIGIAREFGSNIQLLIQPNLGVNAARNNGIRFCNGDLIALCDSDDYWYADKILRQVKEFQRDPTTVLVYTSYHTINMYGEKIDFHQAEYTGDLSRTFILKPSQALTGPPSGVMFRKVIDGELMLFDEKLRGNGEDWDFLRRICQKGKVRAVSEPQFFYRKHPGSRFSQNIETYYLGNKESLKKAMNDPFYNWNSVMKFCFVRRFELMVAKSYFKNRQFIASVKHLIKAHNPFNYDNLGD